MADTVHLFIFDGLADWEPGFAIAGINDPAHQREPGRYVVRTVSPHASRVVSPTEPRWRITSGTRVSST